MSLSTRFHDANRPRTITAVVVLVTVPVLIGMAALTIGVGHMHNVRAYCRFFIR